MRDREAGFSVLELMIVVLIVGTLAGAAFPHVQRTLLRARAVETVADLRAVRMAVLNYHASEGDWPADTERGTVPPELEEYLPDGFGFTRDRYVLDYDDWSESEPYLVGVSAITDEQDLGYLVLDMLGANSWTDGTERYAWVIEWTD